MLDSEQKQAFAVLILKYAHRQVPDTPVHAWEQAYNPKAEILSIIPKMGWYKQEDP